MDKPPDKIYLAIMVLIRSQIQRAVETAWKQCADLAEAEAVAQRRIAAKSPSRGNEEVYVQRYDDGFTDAATNISQAIGRLIYNRTE